MQSSPIIDNSNLKVRSNHNLSFNWLGSTDFGVIRPFHWQELVPGDKVTKCKPRIQIQPLNFAGPTFGRVDVYCHYFWIPFRLIWANALDYFSQGGLKSTASPAPPYWTQQDFYNAYIYGSTGEPITPDGQLDIVQRALYKHWTSFGLPPFFACPAGVAVERPTQKIQILPLRAYNRIWWDFFRDPETLEDSNSPLLLDTTPGHCEVRAASDNFYWPMRRTLKDLWFTEVFANSGTPAYIENEVNFGQIGTTIIPANNPTGTKETQSTVDTSAAMRKAEAIHRMAERLTLSGKRSIDKFFAQYGIKPDYMKMQMCQYLGGAKQELAIQDIISSADTTQDGTGEAGAALGQKAGTGYCELENLNIKFTAEEPGIFMGVFSIMPKMHFVQGIGKEWIREIPEDFYRRELEHTGLVAIPRFELGVKGYGNKFGTGTGTASYAQSPNYNSSKDTESYAFTQPYYDYKRKMDVLCGDPLWYHWQGLDVSGDDKPAIAYLQSLGFWTDFPEDRKFEPENLLMDSAWANNVFFYRGGSVWENVDDHFHCNIDVNCVINRPMDGFAVPTLETTSNPHSATQPVGNDVVL